MNKKEKYLDHIKESWCLAQNATNFLGVTGHMTTNITLAIFEKTLSPYHYFLQNNEPEEKLVEKPTERQISYAQKLRIKEPEKYTKKELSDKIKEVLKNG